MTTASKSNHLSQKEFKTSALSASILSLRLFGLFAILPIFSIYALALPGATIQKVGITLGLYGLTAIIAQPIFGFLSDRFGRLKVIGLGLIIFIAGSIVAAIAPNIHTLMIGRLLQGAGGIGSIVLAVITDHTRPKVRSKAMAIAGIMLTLAFIIAITVGPLLAHSLQLSGLFALTAFLAFLALMLTGFLPRTKAEVEPSGMKFNQIKHVIFNKNIMILNISILLLHAILIASFVILPGVLHTTLNISLKQSWWTYLSSLLIAFIFMIIIINVADLKKRYKHCIVLCVLLIVFAQVLFLTELENLTSITAALTLFFTGFLSLEALLPAWLSRTVKSKARGTAFGFYVSSQFLGAFLGGCFGGYFASSDPKQFFLILLGATVLWFLTISGLLTQEH